MPEQPFSSTHDRMVSTMKYGDPVNPYEMIETPIGRMEAWRAAAIMTGATSAINSVMNDSAARFDQVRADTVGFIEELKGREANIRTREDAVSQRERAVLDLVGGASMLLDRLERYRSDQERFAEEPPLPPGEEPPTSDEEMQPTGHLHEVEAPQDPDLEGTEDEELPPELAKLEPEDPPPPRGSVFPQPTAISLHAADPRQQEED
jgi:hypothetical protein